MNKISYNLTPGTMSQVVIAGLLSMQLLNGSPENGSNKLDMPAVLQASYASDGNTPTFDSFRGAVTGQYDSSSVQFEHSVGNFYARLVSTQEPLGGIFEKVLYDNLWDLYES
jgi:hypothetical protein